MEISPRRSRGKGCSVSKHGTTSSHCCSPVCPEYILDVLIVVPIIGIRNVLIVYQSLVYAKAQGECVCAAVFLFYLSMSPLPHQDLGCAK